MFGQIADSDPSGRTPRCRAHSLGAYARGSCLPGTRTNHESRVLSSRLVKGGLKASNHQIHPKKKGLKNSHLGSFETLSRWEDGPTIKWFWDKAEFIWLCSYIKISTKHGPASSQGFARRSRCCRHFRVSSVSVDCHSLIYCYLWIHVDMQLLCQFKVLTQLPSWFMFSKQLDS